MAKFKISNTVISMLASLTSPVPEQRISSADLLNHDFFKLSNLFDEALLTEMVCPFNPKADVLLIKPFQQELRQFSNNSATQSPKAKNEESLILVNKESVKFVNQFDLLKLPTHVV